MPYQLCRHVKTNGKRCEAPALIGEMWCYFHHRLITRHRSLNTQKSGTAALHLQLPVLEDRESIQVALSLVSHAIVTGVLDEKRAGVLLRAIGIAWRNACGLKTQPLDLDAIVRAYMLTVDGLELACTRVSDTQESLPHAPSSTQTHSS